MISKNFKAFPRPYQMILYIVLVAVFCFLSCMFVKADEPETTIKDKSVDVSSVNTFPEIKAIVYEDENEVDQKNEIIASEIRSKVFQNLEYYFKKALIETEEEELEIEDWMLYSK